MSSAPRGSAASKGRPAGEVALLLVAGMQQRPNGNTGRQEQVQGPSRVELCAEQDGHHHGRGQRERAIGALFEYAEHGDRDADRQQDPDDFHHGVTSQMISFCDVPALTLPPRS